MENKIMRLMRRAIYSLIEPDVRQILEERDAYKELCGTLLAEIAQLRKERLVT